MRPIRVERMASPVGEGRSVQLSYGRKKMWWLEQGSNLRRPVFRTGALPTELSSQRIVGWPAGFEPAMTGSQPIALDL